MSIRRSVTSDFSCKLLARRLHRNHGRLHESAQTPHFDRDAPPDTLGAERAVQIVDIGDRSFIEPQQQVATFEPTALCRPVGARAHDAYGGSAGMLYMAAQTLRNRDGLRDETQVSAPYAPVLQQLQRDPLHRIDRGREADALRRGDDRRIHADHATGAVAQGSPGIAGILGRVRLDHVVDQAPGAAA